MAYQRQQQKFFWKIPATNRQSLNDQAAATNFNHPVQMARANPFATTVVNPSLGMNRMLLGTNNMVIQGQTNPVTSTNSVPANSQTDDRRKRPRVSTANQVNNENYDHFRVPDYAPQNIKDDMIRLRQTHHMLCEQGINRYKFLMQRKRLRMQFAEKQNEAVQNLVENVKTPFQNILKDKDEEILNMRKLNTELQERVKSLRHENRWWMEYAQTCEFQATTLHNDLKVTVAEVSRLKGLVPPNGAVAAPPTNEQRTAQGCIRVEVEDADEIAAEKVQTVAETGESSGVKKMCMSCGNMEVSVLAFPCKHLCFCTVCGTDESPGYSRCPVCDFIVTTTVPINLL